MSAPAAAADLVDDFLKELTSVRRLSPHSVAAYRRDLLRLGSLAGGRPLTALDSAAVRRAAAALHAQGLAPSSIGRMLSAWRTYFRFVAQRRELAVNPALGVRGPRRPQRLPKALSVDQAVALASYAEGDSALTVRDHALVELLYSTGLRLAELVALDVRPHPKSLGWVDFAERELTVTGKGAKRRTVPIGEPALLALRQWLSLRDGLAASQERALFVSQRGTRIAPRSVQLRLRLLGARAGLDVAVHPHVLRHSMASHLLQSSGDLRAVQEMLGHAHIATTQIYTRLDWQHLAKAYDAFHPRAKRKS